MHVRELLFGEVLTFSLYAGEGVAQRTGFRLVAAGLRFYVHVSPAQLILVHVLFLSGVKYERLYKFSIEIILGLTFLFFGAVLASISPEVVNVS